MRRNRLVQSVLLVAALVHLTGCNYDNTSHSGQQWERSTLHCAWRTNADYARYMSATDGVGSMVFAGEPSQRQPRTVITGIPTE